MSKLQPWVLLCMLVAIGLAYRELETLRNTTVVRPSPQLRTGAPAAASSPGAGPSASPSAEGASGELPEWLQREADNISRLQDDPEETQKRLKELAGQVKDADVALLQGLALNPHADGDARFLSVYILGLSDLERAQESLETIALTPLPPSHDARLTNQEEILRAEAVESLRQTEGLKKVLAGTDNSFLSDRAQRNLLYREGKVRASPEQQDQIALTQLLKKPLPH